MALVALLIGAVLIVAAIRNSHASLFSALRTDVPEFAVWAAAIFALGVIGFIPGLKPTSRALLALVFVVIILKNYTGILSGFQSAWQGAAAQAKGGGSSSHSGGPFGSLQDTINSLVSAGGSFNSGETAAGSTASQAFGGL